MFLVHPSTIRGTKISRQFIEHSLDLEMVIGRNLAVHESWKSYYVWEKRTQRPNRENKNTPRGVPISLTILR